MLEMKVEGLTLDPLTNMPIITLKDLSGKWFLPIWVGIFEANAIAIQMEKIATPRPMTHDLIKNIIDGIEAKVNHIVVNDLKDNTFYAVISLTLNNHIVNIDSRPSDAIAVALRVNAPIYVAEKVINMAKGPGLSEGEDIKDQENLKKKNISVENEGHIKAIVVDDEPVIKDIVATLLEMEGYSVSSFENSLEALKHARDKEYDIIVTDYFMPGINGIELIQKIKEVHPYIASVLITGVGSEQTVIDAFTKGNVNSYVTKPFNNEELLRILRLAVKEQKIKLKEDKFHTELKSQIKEATKQLKEKNKQLMMEEKKTKILYKKDKGGIHKGKKIQFTIFMFDDGSG